MKTRGRLTGCLMVMLSTPWAAGADGVRIDGSGSVSAGVWSGNRNLDDERSQAIATMMQKITVEFGPLKLEANLLVSSGDDGKHVDGKVREMYAQLKHGDFTVRAGRQIINWGQADLVNPTQRFATEDYRLRVSQPGWRQGGVDAIRALAVLDGLSADLVAASFHRGSKIPLGPFQQAGFRVSDAGQDENTAVGLRFSGTSGPHEYSVSYFRGGDVMPVYRLASGAALEPAHPNLSVLGADYAYSDGDYSLKMEAAYSKNIGKDTLPLPFDQIHFVGGVERKIGDYTVSILYSQKQIKRFDPNLLVNPLARFNLNALDQLRTSPRNFFGRVTKVFDDLSGNFTLIARKSLDDSSGALVFLIEKSIFENVTLVAGFDKYLGPPTTFAGALTKNDLVWIVVRVSY